VEKVLEDIAFEAPDVSEKSIVVDAKYVKEKIGAIAADEDLSSYIL